MRHDAASVGGTAAAAADICQCSHSPAVPAQLCQLTVIVLQSVIVIRLVSIVRDLQRIRTSTEQAVINSQVGLSQGVGGRPVLDARNQDSGTDIDGGR